MTMTRRELAQQDQRQKTRDNTVKHCGELRDCYSNSARHTKAGPYILKTTNIFQIILHIV